MVEWLNKDMTALSCVQPSFLEELPRQVNVYETANMYLNSSLLWKTLQPWGGRQTWLWQAVCSGGRLRFICSKFILKQHWKLDVRAVCFLHEPGGETSCRTRCAAHSLSLSLSLSLYKYLLRVPAQCQGFFYSTANRTAERRRCSILTRLNLQSKQWIINKMSYWLIDLLRTSKWLPVLYPRTHTHTVSIRATIILRIATLTFHAWFHISLYVYGKSSCVCLHDLR